MKKFVLGFLAMVMATLIIGCATGKNNEVAESVVPVNIPEQQKGMVPFFIRTVLRSEHFNDENLAPLTAVSGYLEAIAAAHHITIRIKEGFLKKRGEQWYLFKEWPREKIRLACTAYQRYYAVETPTAK